MSLAPSSSPATTRERPPAVAGLFYDGAAEALRRDVTALLDRARADRPDGAPVPKALIAPHAGHVYSGALAARAYVRWEPARPRLSRIVLIGPSHRVAFRGLALSGAETWRTPLGAVPVDQAWARARLAAVKGEIGVLDQAHAQEHSLEVHFPFLQCLLDDGFSVVPMVAGRVDPDIVASALDVLWGGPETAILISSDLSHFLDQEACRARDDATAAAIEARAGGGRIGPHDACGCTPINGFLRLAERRAMRVERLGLMTSGDTPRGTPDRVVGYGAWAWFESPGALGAAPVAPSEDIEGPANPVQRTAAMVEAHGARLLALAARGLDHGVRTGAAPPSPDLNDQPEALRAPGAAFVTLSRAETGALRGCIGSVEAYRPLAEDVLAHGFDAGFRDPRFPAVEAVELPGLQVSVAVLTPPVMMPFTDRADLLGRMRPGVDGLIVVEGRRRGLFLPQVWDQLPDPETFLAHLLRKAGLPPDHWSDRIRVFHFESRAVKGRPWADGSDTA